MGKRGQQIYFVAGMLWAGWLRLWHPSKQHIPSKILIVRLDEIGDVVNSLHIPGLLKQAHPSASITCWVKPFVKPLLENDPAIDRVVTLASQLEDEYDTIVDLRGNWDSLRIIRTKKPKMLLERGSTRFRNKYNGGQQHEIYTNLDVIRPLLEEPIAEPRLNIALAEDSETRAAEFIAAHGLSDFAVLHAGARRALRRWPAERFVEIACFLQKEKALNIVFTGDSGDIPYIEQLQAAIPFETYSTAGKLDLVESAALFARAGLFIGNESGPMHIAAAVNIPVIGLFGPGVPVVFYPHGPKCTYIHHVLPCNPCDQVHCVQPQNPCINYISVNELVEKINTLLPGTQ